jgi:hypothetical protein
LPSDYQKPGRKALKFLHPKKRKALRKAWQKKERLRKRELRNLQQEEKQVAGKSSYKPQAKSNARTYLLRVIFLSRGFAIDNSPITR